MAIEVPGLASEVAQLNPNAKKAGNKFSYRERLLLQTVKNYVDSLPAGSITLSELSSGIAPSHVAKFGGKHTATAAATQVIAVAGVLASDIVMVTIESQAGTVYVLDAAPSAGTITVVGSAAFGAGDIISYLVFRAAS